MMPKKQGLTNIDAPTKKKRAYKGPSNPILIGHKLTTAAEVRSMIALKQRAHEIAEHKRKRTAELQRMEHVFGVKKPQKNVPRGLGNR